MAMIALQSRNQLNKAMHAHGMLIEATQDHVSKPGLVHGSCLFVGVNLITSRCVKCPHAIYYQAIRGVLQELSSICIHVDWFRIDANVF